MAKVQKAPETADEKVQRLISEVKRRRDEINVLNKPQWTTSCSLQLPGFDRMNIQIEDDMTKLAVSVGVLANMRQSCLELQEDTGVPIPAIWQGYEMQHWVADIMLRIKVAQLRVKKQRLHAMEQSLDSLLSSEQRRKLELARIEQELKE